MGAVVSDDDAHVNLLGGKFEYCLGQISICTYAVRRDYYFKYESTLTVSSNMTLRVGTVLVSGNSVFYMKNGSFSNCRYDVFLAEDYGTIVMEDGLVTNCGTHSYYPGDGTYAVGGFMTGHSRFFMKGGKVTQCGYRANPGFMVLTDEAVFYMEGGLFEDTFCFVLAGNAGFVGARGTFHNCKSGIVDAIHQAYMEIYDGMEFLENGTGTYGFYNIFQGRLTEPEVDCEKRGFYMYGGLLDSCWMRSNRYWSMIEVTCGDLVIKGGEIRNCMHSGSDGGIRITSSLYNSDASIIRGVNNRKCEIENLVIKDSGDMNSTIKCVMAIFFYDTTATVRNCRFENIGGRVFGITDMSDITIEDCVIDDALVGIQTEETDSRMRAEAIKVLFKNCTFTNVRRYICKSLRSYNAQTTFESCRLQNSATAIYADTGLIKLTGDTVVSGNTNRGISMYYYSTPAGSGNPDLRALGIEYWNYQNYDYYTPRVELHDRVEVRDNYVDDATWTIYFNGGAGIFIKGTSVSNDTAIGRLLIEDDAKVYNNITASGVGSDIKAQGNAIVGLNDPSAWGKTLRDSGHAIEDWVIENGTGEFNDAKALGSKAVYPGYLPNTNVYNPLALIAAYKIDDTVTRVAAGPIYRMLNNDSEGPFPQTGALTIYWSVDPNSQEYQGNVKWSLLLDRELQVGTYIKIAQYAEEVIPVWGYHKIEAGDIVDGKTSIAFDSFTRMGHKESFVTDTTRALTVQLCIDLPETDTFDQVNCYLLCNQSPITRRKLNLAGRADDPSGKLTLLEHEISGTSAMIKVNVSDLMNLVSVPGYRMNYDEAEASHIEYSPVLVVQFFNANGGTVRVLYSEMKINDAYWMSRFNNISIGSISGNGDYEIHISDVPANVNSIKVYLNVAIKNPNASTGNFWPLWSMSDELDSVIWNFTERSDPSAIRADLVGGGDARVFSASAIAEQNRDLVFNVRYSTIHGTTPTASVYQKQNDVYTEITGWNIDVTPGGEAGKATVTVTVPAGTTAGTYRVVFAIDGVTYRYNFIITA